MRSHLTHWVPSRLVQLACSVPFSLFTTSALYHPHWGGGWASERQVPFQQQPRFSVQVVRSRKLPKDYYASCAQTLCFCPVLLCWFVGVCVVLAAGPLGLGSKRQRFTSIGGNITQPAGPLTAWWWCAVEAAGPLGGSRGTRFLKPRRGPGTNSEVPASLLLMVQWCNVCLFASCYCMLLTAFDPLWQDARTHQ